RRVRGKRAVHGEADWMKMPEAGKMFPATGGIVIGERYRVDHDNVAAVAFRADSPDSWGAGGRSPLLCFDGSFGSSHGIVFAGSGGFKTTSVTIPTALKWGGGLVVLDPSSEVAPMVADHGRAAAIGPASIIRLLSRATGRAPLPANLPSDAGPVSKMPRVAPGPRSCRGGGSGHTNQPRTPEIAHRWRFGRFASSRSPAYPAIEAVVSSTRVAMTFSSCHHPGRIR
ncbi:MAG: type IV secretory system conjugative DNA transfer family protein, partial [Caldilineaceae bacterium]|nr:type IV secretory system conjugative DNA transfer family protein [Caldilineaceae bacterium]